MIEHTETFPNGRTHTIRFTSPFPGLEQWMLEGYIQNRKDVQELGLEGAMQKWHDDEARERRKLGLTVKDQY